MKILATQAAMSGSTAAIILGFVALALWVACASYLAEYAGRHGFDRRQFLLLALLIGPVLGLAIIVAFGDKSPLVAALRERSEDA